MIEISKVKLIQGDCLEAMKTLPDKSIDLTVTSPPYDNLRSYNGNIDQWCFEKFQEIVKELYRITKDGGVIVWIVGDSTINGSETGTSFKQALYFKEIGFNIHDTMIWEKPNPMPRDTRIPRYWQAFEYMFVFSKGKPLHFTFLRENTKSSRISQFHQRTDNDEFRDDRKDKTKNNIVQKTKPLSNVWTINSCVSNTERTGHPAQFPEKLAADHIISWSNEGDTVLDPFMGSGTTGKMAVLNNRNFVGIELDEDYFKIASERIHNCKTQKESENQ